VACEHIDGTQAQDCECNGAVEHIDSTRQECVGEYNSAAEHIDSAQQDKCCWGLDVEDAQVCFYYIYLLE